MSERESLFQDAAPKRLIAFPFRPMNLGITRSDMERS